MLPSTQWPLRVTIAIMSRHRSHRLVIIIVVVIVHREVS
jgi:hypothetical protein